MCSGFLLCFSVRVDFTCWTNASSSGFPITVNPSSASYRRRSSQGHIVVLSPWKQEPISILETCTLNVVCFLLLMPIESSDFLWPVAPRQVFEICLVMGRGSEESFLSSGRGVPAAGEPTKFSWSFMYYCWPQSLLSSSPECSSMAGISGSCQVLEILSSHLIRGQIFSCLQ